MAWFTKKEWKNRLAEFAGRRTLTDVATGASQVVDVARNEGTISQEGDAFSAANMNEFEQRILEGFTQAENATTVLNQNMGGLTFAQDSEGKWGYKPSGADSVIPFKSGVNSFTRAGIYQECVNKDGSFTVNESGWYIIWLKTTGANQYKINDVVYSLPECSGKYKNYYGMFDIKYLNVGDVCKSYFDLNALCIELVNFD
jgi:hypothetical protein